MALDDLMNIMDSLQAAPAEPKATHVRYPALALPEQLPQWLPADYVVDKQLVLSRYQLYWLKWRMIVHLRSYEAMEWSEMKEVLEQVIKLIEGVENGNRTTNELPTVAGTSEPPSQDTCQSGQPVL